MTQNITDDESDSWWHETCRLGSLLDGIPCGGGTMRPCTRRRIKASIRREKLRSVLSWLRLI